MTRKTPIAMADIPAWKQEHPLETLWNQLYYPYKGRPAQRRQVFLHYARQRYTDHSTRGKGNKTLRRARALYRDQAVLHWPDYCLP